MWVSQISVVGLEAAAGQIWIISAAPRQLKRVSSRSAWTGFRFNAATFWHPVGPCPWAGRYSIYADRSPNPAETEHLILTKRDSHSNKDRRTRNSRNSRLNHIRALHLIGAIFGDTGKSLWRVSHFPEFSERTIMRNQGGPALRGVALR